MYLLHLRRDPLRDRRARLRRPQARHGHALPRPHWHRRGVFLRVSWLPAPRLLSPRSGSASAGSGREALTRLGRDDAEAVIARPALGGEALAIGGAARRAVAVPRAAAQGA